MEWKHIWLCGLLIFVILIILIVSLKLHFKDLAVKQEGFTDSQPWELSHDQGFKPIVLRNADFWPIKKLAILSPGSVSEIVGKYFQRRVYPVTLHQQPSTIVVLGELSSGNIDLGFCREPQLLELSRTETGIRSVSVLAPAYWETIYAIGNKFTTFSALAQLKLPKSATGDEITNRPKIGVLRDSLPYWSAIIRALDLEIGRDFQKVENDDLAGLFTALESNEVSAVFMIVHSADARLRAYLKSNESRMISIYPLSKFPIDTDMLTRPYNPETTDLITQFRSDIKVYIPWIFDATISLGTPVNNKPSILESVETSSIGTSGSSVYKTFKVRSYLCASREMGQDSELIPRIGNAFLKEYQSFGLLLTEWGGATNRSKAGLGNDRQLVLPTIIFSDYDSFNPDLLGAIPNEIELNPMMRECIGKTYGRITVKTSSPGCDL